MIGDIIKNRRLELGYSQLHLALRVGTNQGRVSEWESNSIIPSSHSLIKLCIALDLEIADLEGVIEHE